MRAWYKRSAMVGGAASGKQGTGRNLPWRRIGGLVVVVLAVAFVLGGLVHSAWVNVDWHRHDQDAYLRYAMQQRETGFSALGQRFQSPAYPTLLALLDTPGTTIEQLFERGKLVGIVISLLLSLFVTWLLFKKLPRLEATALSVLVVFFVFAFRAAYVQVENLSYVSLFLLFLLFVRFYQRPTLSLAALVGVALAVAWLIKGTALLGFQILALSVLVREAYLLVREGKPFERLRPPALLAVSFGTFFGCVFPYAKNSKEHFGSYLYNASSTYVVWCDSWEDWLELDRRAGPHEKLHLLPPDQVPSMGNYVRSHGVGQILWREVRGLGEVLGNCLVSHGYALFVLLFAGFAIGVCVKHADLRRGLFPRDARSAVWFVVAYVLIHVLAYGFYGPIGAGNRFILGIFLPTMYAVTHALAKHTKPQHTLRVRGTDMSWRTFLGAILVLLAMHLVTYWPVAIASHYSGG
ncbi:MAG TPA: hypothetical protein VF316_20880 [Polyangiaceae bacterium]